MAVATHFISIQMVNSQPVIIVDGSAEEAVKTKIDGGLFVQLRRARTEESGFSWDSISSKEVVLKHVLIYDETDVACLVWFVFNKFKIQFSYGAYTSTDILEELVEKFKYIKSCGQKVMEGSNIIRLPEVDPGSVPI